MSQRRVSKLSSSSLAHSFGQLFGKRTVRERRKKLARVRFLEQLESRTLMALDILSVSPIDGATNVPVNSDLVITFNESVLKGQGNIHVVQDSTGKLGAAVDVTSSAVTISGSVVTVDLPDNLSYETNFTVFIDAGAFIDTSGTTTADATLLTQNFEFLPLGPAIFENGGDGTDFTLVPPLGFSVDNSNMPTGGVPEWSGWSFADKNFWAQVDDQSRSAFTLGQGTIAIADSDEWADTANGGGNFNSVMQSKVILLDGVTANTVKLDFDSSFRPENSQIGTLDVRYDGGSWTNLLTLDPSTTTDLGDVNVHKTVTVDNPDSGTMEFRWGLVGGNDWWWGLDNLEVTGQISGVPYAGLSDPLFWNFTTEVEPILTVDIDVASMSENGGTAIGTVTRNIGTTGDLEVTLTSSDTTEATVPATVTILDGQSSATFTITAVDDILSDRAQTVTISASAANFTSGSKDIEVLDDDGLNIVSLTPEDNSVVADFQGNLTINFDGDVKAGDGFIHIVRASDHVLGVSVNVNSASVTISGGAVTINPPVDLAKFTEYYVLIDDGAIIDTSSTVTANATLLMQNFDLLPLAPFNTETGGDGTDYTRTPPSGFTVANGDMTTGGLTEWNGWSFADKNSWIAATGNGGRSDFTLGDETVAVADPDAWDNPNGAFATYNTFLTTVPIDLAGIAAGSVALDFDSSFAASGLMLGNIEVTYNNGVSWTLLAYLGGSSARNAHIRIDNSSVIGSTVGGAEIFNKLNNPSSGTMRFRFNLAQGSQNGWWAVDNLRVGGQVTGIPFEGISDPATWNFTTSEPILTVAIDRTSMGEVGGVATGTVTRNMRTSSDLVVTLSSNDTSEATVPATVTILAGETSATFPITAVDDGIADGDQLAVISATAPAFVAGQSEITVLSVAFIPLDDSSAVPVSSDLVITFDRDVEKGNGFVNIVRASDNTIAASIDIQSPDVTIAGAAVTINPPNNLDALTDYYILLENGAVLYTEATVTTGAMLLSEDFELLPLGPAQFEVPLNDLGLDWTASPPAGFDVDNSQMPPGGVPEWTGWTFANKDFWANAGGQGRSSFTRGSGTVAIGDTDEWDDAPRPSNAFNSIFSTSAIDLTTVEADSVTLEFDSSFRPEGGGTAGNQTGIVDVSYDGGSTWENVLTLDADNSSSDLAATNIDERRSLTVANPGTGSMKFRFGVTGTNDYWWAIDNITVTGDVNGLPYAGITDSTFWNFTTADTETLSVSVDPATIAENGGVGTGTVTRNLGTVGDLVVTLTSSDPTQATVPATVTILDGESSATFDITAVDDAYADGLRNVVISAETAGFVSGSATASIADDEVANVILSEIMFNPAGSEPRTEWVELYNNGADTADISGWKFADEDVHGVLQWGSIPDGTLLPAGSVAVVYNSWYGATTESMFRTEWNVDADAVVIGIDWSDLNNSPSAVNEMLMFKDAGGAEQDYVNFDDDGTVWPIGANGPSIYLTNVTLDNNDGASWASSVLGEMGAVNPIGPTYSTSDVASPGYVFVDKTAPIVSKVMVGSSAWSTGFIDSVDGGGAGAGNGLGFELTAGASPLVWSNVNRLYVQFSEDVGNVSLSTLELRDSAGTLPFTVSYNAATFMATLDLSSPLVFSKLRLAASDAIVDLSGNTLDGDSSGAAGGIFDLRFDVLPGDADHNGRVNGSDLAAFSAAFNTQIGQANFNPDANWNGDDRVNGSDLAVFSLYFNKQISTLANPGPAFGGGGSMTSFSQPNDSFFSYLGDDETKKEEEGSTLDLLARTRNSRGLGRVR